MKGIVEQFGYYDIFLINPDGKVIYSEAKEADFATDLVCGPYSESGLARAFETVRQEKGTRFVHVEDYSFYRPSFGQPAAFVAAPVFSDAKLAGVIAIQFSTDSLQDIVTQDMEWETSGLGKTGEVLLVGQDFRLRAVSRPFLEDRDAYLDALRRQGVKSQTLNRIKAYDSPILLQEASSRAVQGALGGETGTLIADNYLGQPALMSYAPLRLEALDWGMVTEISLAEAYQPVYDFQRRVLVTAVGLSVLVTLLAMVLSAFFTKPIRALMAGAREIRAGNLNADLTIQTGDELEELSTTLTGVVSDLHDRTEQMRQVRLRNESLLLRFLPDSMVKRLQEKGVEEEGWKTAETVPNVSVILGQLSGYEAMMQQFEPAEVVGMLDTLVEAVDEATERFGVEKVRTFGDSYLAVCGLSTPHLDHTRRAIDFAREMRAIIRRFQMERGGTLAIKITIASGSVISGIIGKAKLTFDIYGFPVNEVQYLNQICPPDEIYVSQAVSKRLSDFLTFEPVASEEAWRLVAQAKAPQAAQNSR